MGEKISLYIHNEKNKGETVDFQKTLLEIIYSKDFSNITSRYSFSPQEEILLNTLQGIEQENIKITLGHRIQHLKSGAELKDLLIFDDKKLIIPYDPDHKFFAQKELNKYNMEYQDTPRDEKNIKQALEYVKDGKIILVVSNHASIGNKPFEIDYINKINEKYNILSDIGSYHNTVMGPLIGTRDSMKNTINGLSNLYITQPETDLPKEKNLIQLSEETRKKIQTSFTKNIIIEFQKDYGQIWHFAPGGSKDIIIPNEKNYQIVFGDDTTTSTEKTIGLLKKSVEKNPDRFAIILMGMDETRVQHNLPISIRTRLLTGKEFIEYANQKKIMPTVAKLTRHPESGEKVGFAINKQDLINLYQQKK